MKIGSRLHQGVIKRVDPCVMRLGNGTSTRFAKNQEKSENGSETKIFSRAGCSKL